MAQCFSRWSGIFENIFVEVSKAADTSEISIDSTFVKDFLPNKFRALILKKSQCWLIGLTYEFIESLKATVCIPPKNNMKIIWDYKRRMSYALDFNGNRIPKLDSFGNQKTDSHGHKQWKRISTTKNLLDDKNFLLQLRKNWADEVNKHLSPELHIDHRSHSARGLLEKPTIHEGYAARAIERKGGISERCQLNRDIKDQSCFKKRL